MIIYRREFFQFTTSQGGRRAISSALSPSSSFQFTTSQGGRPDLSPHSPQRCRLSIHDLTRRSTFPLGQKCYNTAPFNSRPHKEVDFNRRRHYRFYALSIHDLTRRSTPRVDIPPIVLGLSIHDLTRRSTPPGSILGPLYPPFNSRPHKEVDWYDSKRCLANSPFNSRPHKEVDGPCPKLALHI